MRGAQSNPKMQLRYGGLTDSQGRWTSEVRLMTQDLEKPLSVRKPTTWAIWNDLLHEDVPFPFIGKAWHVMDRAYWHTFLLLTKRPERFAELNQWLAMAMNYKSPLPNVQIGTTVENGDYLWRVDELLRMPAVVRFVSLEPLLGPIDLKLFHTVSYDDLTQAHNRLNWCIIGAESGPNARYCDLDWIRDIIMQCEAAGVKKFVKQLGTHWAKKQDAHHWRGHNMDYKGADMSYWPADLRVREYPKELQ